MLTPDRDEILRYLGYRGAEPDPETENSIDECLATLLPELQPREIHRFFPLQRTGEHSLRIEGMEVTSRALSRSLRDCEEVCLFAATIGFAPDRLAARFSAARKMSRAVIIQAAGAALIEAWCDEVSDMIRREAAARGLWARPRFSPGYGDFPLSFQEDLFRILNVQKTIGVTLTESLLMMPSKSVTAVTGLSQKDASCPSKGCEMCGMAGTCPYSRR